MGTSPNSPKTSGISSSSRSYRQITQIRRPEGVSANIWYDPSFRFSRRKTRSNAASTSSAERACSVNLLEIPLDPLELSHAQALRRRLAHDTPSGKHDQPQKVGDMLGS